MLSAARTWLPVGLLVIMGVKDSYGGAIHDRHAHYDPPDYSVTTTTLPPIVVPCISTANLLQTISTCSTTTVTALTTTTASITKTVPSTITVLTTSTTTTPTTTILSITKTVPFTITALTTLTTTMPTTTTSPTTTTVPTTITVFVTTTVLTTITETSTTPTTVTVLTTTTIPTTTTVTQTFTTFPPRTSYTTLTVYDPCPSSCSIFAGTVNLIYWPTDKPHSYPATYFDTSRGYTFTSPSVYMLINTMYGTNSRGKVGPDASSTIWAFDLDEVSTLVLPAETATRQLSLSDLGTDCPQTLPASVIATKRPEPRCDPVLLAPSAIRSWAWPCNACGRFGLFDPPYAIPTLAGGLLGTTTAMPAPTSRIPIPVPTSPIPIPVPTTTPAPEPTEPSTTLEVPATVPTASSPTISSSNPPAAAAAAARVTGGTACLILSLIVSVLLFG